MEHQAERQAVREELRSKQADAVRQRAEAARRVEERAESDRAAAREREGLRLFEQICEIDGALGHPSASEASFRNADGSWK
eukprot:1350667-Prymnesium_polylepis.1